MTRAALRNTDRTEFEFMGKELIRRTEMPYVNIQILEGATREQKSRLIRDVTESLVQGLGKKPEHIHVVIQEIAEANWGFAGLPTDAWRAQHEGESPGDRTD